MGNVHGYKRPAFEFALYLHRRNGSIIQADPFADIIKPHSSVANAPFSLLLKLFSSNRRIPRPLSVISNTSSHLDHTVYADFSAARFHF